MHEIESHKPRTVMVLDFTISGFGDAAHEMVDVDVYIRIGKS